MPTILFPKKTILLLLLLAVATQAFSAYNTDSLKKELSKATDKRTIADLSMFTGRSLFFDDSITAALVFQNKALQFYQVNGPDTMTVKALLFIGDCYRKTSRADESLPYYEKARQLAHTAEATMLEVTALNDLGKVWQFKGKHALAISFLKQSLAIVQHTNDRDMLAYVHTMLGAEYNFTDELAFAIENLTKSIEIYDSLKDNYQVALCYQELCVVFTKRKEYTKALKYADIADSLFIVLKDTASLYDNYVNVGTLYSKMGYVDSAIKMYKIRLQYQNDNIWTRVITYISLGSAYSEKGMFNEARAMLLKGLDINTNVTQNGYTTIGIHYELARAYQKAGHIDSAIYFAKECQRLCVESDIYPEERSTSLALIAKAYASKKQFDSAYTYLARQVIVDDTIYQQNKAKIVEEAESRFMLAENNRALETLSKENEMRGSRVRNLAVLSLFGAVLIIIILVLYNRSANKNKLLSEQKRIINDQVKQLKAAAEAKSKFLANITHELRTPVTLLTGMLDMLAKNGENGKAADKLKLEIAGSNSRRLQKMIEELLDLSKAESKISTVNSTVKEVAPILKRIVFAFESFIEKQQLTLEYDDNTPVDTYVSVDEDKFEKIINNLIYNAVKFNKPDGAVKVKAKVADDGKWLQIIVADTGTGIPAADLPHVFERFYQGASGLKAKSEGMGIGLSLVKEFTGLLGGTIDVSSTPGSGTIFTLSLPVVEKPVDGIATRAEVATPESWERFSSRNTILVVEDNGEMRYYLREILGSNANIVEAGNGIEALKWLEQNTPDLIISDIMMPEMDGREFIGRVKASEKDNKIPVITLSALADMGDHLSMLRLGVDDYIVKPFNADELRIRAYNLLSNFAVRKEAASEASSPEEEPIPDDSQADEFRDKIKKYVLSNIRNEHMSVGDLAREMILSERQLYRLSKSLTGFSPAQLIKEVRLQKAYELLTNGDVRKIDDLATRVGFEASTYFSRVFFERFGKRPNEFL